MSDQYPMTMAIRFLQDHGVSFTPHLFEYEEKGGTSVSSKKLGVSEHSVIKTLIFENDSQEPFVVLMHGDCQVSTKNLARLLEVKKISPCKPEIANKHSGYVIGGTSPFGTKKQMPIYAERTILDLPEIYINGGQRGFLVAIDPQELVRTLKVTAVDVAVRS